MRPTRTKPYIIGVMSPDKLPAYAKLVLSKLAGPASSETATAD